MKPTRLLCLCSEFHPGAHSAGRRSRRSVTRHGSRRCRKWCCRWWCKCRRRGDRRHSWRGSRPSARRRDRARCRRRRSSGSGRRLLALERRAHVRFDGFGLGALALQVVVPAWTCRRGSGGAQSSQVKQRESSCACARRRDKWSGVSQSSHLKPNQVVSKRVKSSQVKSSRT
jgi:hypothetical protein